MTMSVRKLHTKAAGKVKCRDFFKCEKKECPAFSTESLECWLVTGTQCRDEIQGRFADKLEMCFSCGVLKKNMDVKSMKKSCMTAQKQIMEFSRTIQEKDRELQSIGMGLAEHFDVLRRVSAGDSGARVTGESQVEFLESLKKVTNEIIESMDREINEHKRTEELLHESERKYRDFYQNAPDGYHSLGPDGTILEVNDMWLRMLGYERDEVVGRKKLTDLLPDDAKHIFRRTFPELKQRGSTEHIEYSLIKKDGALLPVVINATAVFDDKGDFLQTRSIVRDNSERNRYENMLRVAAEEWRVTFDSMPNGVFLVDRNFTVMRANKYISSLYGIRLEDLKGKPYHTIVSAGQVKDAADAGRLFADTAEFYDAGLQRYFIQHITPIPDAEGLTKAFTISLVDITVLKDKENKLTESKDAFFNMLKELDASYRDLKGLLDSLIRSFVNAMDAKSPWTKGHSERVTYYTVAIAQELGLKEKEIETLRTASLLHDIGKIGTYDVVLDKPGKLTDEEFALIRQHPVKGESILKPIKQFVHLLPIVRHHHEMLDGRGYPDGLKDVQIPYLSKIITIADSYDSMTSDRPYRPAPPKEYAISELKRCTGTQFDAEAVEAFLKVLHKEGGPAGSPGVIG